MSKKKIISGAAAVAFLVAFSFFETARAALEIPDDEKWLYYDDYNVINADTTWKEYKTNTGIDPAKPFVVVDGATLTFEPGDQIEAFSVSVYLGRIVANGTEQNKITFTKAAPILPEGCSTEDVPMESPTDPESGGGSDLIAYCPYSSGTIEFDDYSRIYGGEPSVFNYVEFRDMGINRFDHNRNSFVAEPALKLRDGNVRIENSSFMSNNYSDVAVDVGYYEDGGEPPSNLEIVNSNFEGNAQGNAVISHALKYANENADPVSFGDAVRLSNNWYGDPSGPKTDLNPFANGEVLQGDYTLLGHSEKRFESEIGGASNVLFLPGLEASRLYDGDNQLWEPNRNTDAEKLYLDEDGKSLNADIFTSEIIDEVNISPILQKNIYKSFESDLKKWKNEDKIINDYAIAPYDWRLSLGDILNSGIKTGNNISYNQSTENPYIIQELKRLAETSKSGRVTIIAHSNGGLLTKALVNKLGTEAADLIDKIIFVAAPQSGTPQAIGGLLHGYDQGLPYDWFYPFLSPKTARKLAENMPSAYNLLPSKAYFNGDGSETDTPVISFKDGTLTQSFIEKYGHEIKEFDKLQDFLSDDENKVSADSNNTEQPSILNHDLIDYGKNTHEAIDDDWELPPSISVYQIAGFGEETLGKIKYWTGTECILPVNGYCLKYQDKLQYTPNMVIDGDGTVVAPSALAMSDDNENVKRYWVDLDDYNDVFTLEREHADILEVPELRNFIKNNILTQSTENLPDYISNSKPSNNSEKRLQYILHSPLALSVHAGAENEISALASTIPDARYKRFGEVQYISIPADISHTVILDGTDQGSFTLEMQEAEGDNIVATAVFAGIPSSSDTKVTMNVIDGTIQSASPLEIDYDGDNTVDFSLEPKVGETVSLHPLDQTPPEVKIFFDTETKSITVEGIDENPTAVAYSIISASEKNKKQKDKTIVATITDQAGNATILTYIEKFPNRERRTVIELKLVSYNGVVTDFDNTTLKYKWNTNKKDGAYKIFASHIHTASKILESHYRPKKNVTIIMTKPQELNDSDEDDDCDKRPVREKLSGMIIPWLITNQGNISVNY